MSREPKGLGKGLSALLGDATPSADQLRKPVGYINKDVVGARLRQDSSDIFRIPMDMIEANPFQPRMSFDQESLEELAASIRTLGLIQPITVRKISGNQYQIISGERRFKACRMAGMTMIPAYVRDANDQGMLEMAIVENVQRENLDPIETALSYRRLIEECNLTQDQMADRLGKKRATVTNMLRLLKLPAKVQHDLKVGLLSVGHAKAILGIEDNAVQERLCDIVLADGLSVRQLEALVRKIQLGDKLPQTKAKKEAPALPENYTRLASCMGRFFTKDIAVKRNESGRGSVTIKFSSDEEIERFLEALENAQV